MSVRKNHTPVFKSKVALDAFKGDLTLSELSTKHGVHSSQITKWKRHALEGLSKLFSDGKDSSSEKHAKEIKELYTKIGKLTVENDFLLEASAHLTVCRGKK